MTTKLMQDFNELSFIVNKAIDALESFHDKHGNSLSTIVLGIADDLGDAMASIEMELESQGEEV